jgi:putative membrane protein
MYERGYMGRILASWLVAALSVMITAWLLPGITVTGLGGALIAAAVIGFFNSLVRPFLTLITLPITILSLGLFLFVVNAICFSMAAYFAGSAIQVDNFFWSLLGAVVLAVVSTIMGNLFRTRES